MYKLVKFEGNYADEFNVKGFDIYTDAELSELFDRIEEYFDYKPGRAEFYFGSNEAMTYSSYFDIKSDIGTVDISIDDMTTMYKLFGGKSWGTFRLSNIISQIDDDDEFKEYLEEKERNSYDDDSDYNSDSDGDEDEDKEDDSESEKEDDVDIDDDDSGNDDPSEDDL